MESRVANLVFGLIHLRSEVAYPKIILKKGNLSYDDINAYIGFNNLDSRKKYLESLNLQDSPSTHCISDLIGIYFVA